MDFQNLAVLEPYCSEALSAPSQEYGIEFSSYFNVMWREPRLHVPDKYLGNFSMEGEPDLDCDSGNVMSYDVMSCHVF